MNRNKTTYRKTTSILTLCLYLGFLIIAVFHVHKYEFQTNLIINFADSNSSDVLKDPFLDSNSNCRLVEFLHANFSFSNIHPADILPLPAPKKILLNDDSAIYSSSENLTHLLRAPPLT